MNIWAGLINDKIIGPVEIPSIVNGENYRNFLINVLPGLMREKLTFEERGSMIYQHDGAPAHTAGATQRVLCHMFRRGFIGKAPN